MRIVVAGATGLIGRSLVPALARAGDEVVVLTRSAAPAVAGAPAVRWDGRRLPESVLDGVDGVVNLSGASIGGRRWTAARKRLLLESRVQSTAALVEAAGRLPAAQRPRVLVNASGIDYAGATGDEVVDESSPAGTTFLAGVCASWEAAALAAEAHGVRVVLLRTALVLDREATALRLLALPFRLFAGGRLGSGRQWFPWVHLTDVVRVYREALADEALQGPVDLVAPELVRQAEVARELGRILRRPGVLPAPSWLLRLALGEQADLLLGGQRAVSRTLDTAAFLHPRLAGALEEALGRAPTPPPGT